MTIGGQLRSARQERGYDLSSIAEQTKISRMYLEAIEADQPNRLPGLFFYKSFVRQYAQALNVSPDRFVFEDPETEPAMPALDVKPRQQEQQPKKPVLTQPQTFQPKWDRKAQPVRDRDQYVKLIDSASLTERRLLTTFFALMCVLAGGAMVYSWTQPNMDRATAQQPAVTAPQRP